MSVEVCNIFKFCIILNKIHQEWGNMPFWFVTEINVSFFLHRQEQCQRQKIIITTQLYGVIPYIQYFIFITNRASTVDYLYYRILNFIYTVQSNYFDILVLYIIIYLSFQNTVEFYQYHIHNISWIPTINHWRWAAAG